MINGIVDYLDRNAVISIIITLIIATFYSYTISIIYIAGLIAVILIKYKWNAIDIKLINGAFKNIAVIAVTVLCLTVIGEIWLHLYPHKFTNIDRIDTLGEFSDYTSRGYLTEAIFKKRPGVVRILGLGDSFSVFLGDEGKNYINLLSKMFIAKGRGDLEIVNAGMEAIGPGYYWHILRKYGDSFHPDLVLVGFFVGNDFGEADFYVNIGNFMSEPNDLIKRYLRYYQFRNLRLYRLLKNKYNNFREGQLKKQEIQRNPSQQVGTFSQETFLEVERTRSWIFDKNKRDDLEQKWRECAAILLKMKEWCDRRKIKLVIAILPDQFQVDPELRKEIFAHYKRIKEENMELTQPVNLIVNFCRAQNIHCLDLLGQFQEQGKTRQLYTLRNTHWNEAGNRLAASLIFEYLEKNQLIIPRARQ